MVDEMDEVISEFLIESHENLDRLDRDLVELEKDPRSPEIIASIFRTIHTIKGTSGFLGFEKLERLAHAAENLLGKLRDGELVVDREIATALLRTGDALRELLGSIEATGTEGDGDHGDLVATLTRLQGPKGDAAGSGSAEAAQPGAPARRSRARGSGKRSVGTVAPEGAPAAPSGPADRSVVGSAPSDGGEAAADQQAAKPSVTETTIRVDVGLLDSLMNLVGELVLARNQILQLTSSQGSSMFQAAAQRLNLITTELQEGVMKARMQPIGSVWGKFPRIVRDLAVACGKQVRIEMEGEETELDRSIIEAIKDPLTHLVRNAVDHGIEPPDARVAAGKPPEGRLVVRAFHEGGQVNIEIVDDGAGIDPERVLAKALERGFVGPDRAARMSEREILDLIFRPGFSTAERVTNVSGRGVGMDVVRTNIERIGGSVDVHSRRGEGTTFRVKIPLTLAIIPALIVTCGGDRYAIPQVNLLELVRLDAARAERAIERIHDCPVYRLRGKLLPLVYLDRELGLADGDGGSPDDSVSIVVLQADDRRFGLLVHSILDTEEIVVKPLGSQLKGLSTYAGATIMGDGQVALILDVWGLAQRAGIVSEAHERGALDLLGASERSDVGERREAFVLCEGPDAGRVAVPLSAVERLEELEAASVERLGRSMVVQYRGEILPLVPLGAVLEERRRRPRNAPRWDVESAGPLQVLVLRHEGAMCGLIVDRILDIVEEVCELRPATRGGVLGCRVVQGRVTEFLDVAAVFRWTEFDHERSLVMEGAR
jgi:two-component system chemotaxis sensor kinase CheA